MKEYDLNQLINNPSVVDEKISDFISKGILRINSSLFVNKLSNIIKENIR